jgi:pimeloyl-ACP methyl ester carboxylesterase
MRGLILIDTPVKSPVPIPDQDKRYFVSFMDNNYDAFLAMMFKPLGRDSTQGKLIHAGAATVPPNTIKSYLREMLNMDENKSLKSLHVPLALLLSERVSPPGQSWGETAKKLGWEDSTRVVPHRIADAGYWVMKDQPDSLAAFILDFEAAQLSAKR